MQQSEAFTEGHARALLKLSNEENQLALMQQIVAQRLSVRQAEELASKVKAAEDGTLETVAQTAPPHSPELTDLEAHFREALMVKVHLKYNAKGKGTLVLHFNSQDELENLYNRLVKHEE
ncbi:ParB/RepB/Spo0J family partition protein [Ktedonosporobacter rubrisoli]|uniref:ParB/RepB/Spo0J family partition protein n=1 Tax=Ktedonosporobacter rubrisoli TaxID=2509675 RepID=UPI0013EED58C